MRRLFSLLACLFVPLAALAQNDPPAVSLSLSKATVAPGEDVKGTITVTFAPGLHAFQNPIDDPNLIPVAIKAGEGTTLKPVAYPKGHMAMFAGTEVPLYSGTVKFPVVVTAPNAPGKATVNLGFYFQQCNDSTCFRPTTINVSADLTVKAEDDPPPIKITTGPGEGLRNPATAPSVTFKLPESQVFVGETFVVTLRLTLPKGTFLFAPPEKASPVFVSGLGGTMVRAIGTPEGSPMTLDGTKGLSYSGDVEVPVTVSAQPKAGSQEVVLHMTFVPWDNKGMLRPQNRQVRFGIEVSDKQAEPIATVSTVDTPADQPQSDAPETEDGVLGFVNNALESGNWALIVPAALLAGLALCLTPCVFPMIPVTVSFFSNQGSKTTGGRFTLGLFYALGIAATYGAVGGISAAAGGFVGELFTKQWFVLALAALLVALALSMFDVYEIRLPSFLQKNLKGRSGPVGALIMGLLMGFAAAPCAGALVGAVAVKVADIASIPTGIGMFGLIGLGMGLPFMVLATASSGAKALPKSGGWLKTTKAVLGLIVLYVAAGYVFQGLGLRPGLATTQIAWVAVFAAFAAYLLFLDKSEPSRAVTTIKGVSLLALGVFAGLAYAQYGDIIRKDALKGLAMDTDSQVSAAGITWIPYNDENFAKAVASGRPIMIDGKADWCLRCREIEHGIFETPEGLKALSGVYLMSIDWSTGTPDAYIDSTTERFDIHGLPHIVFMKPGGKDEFSVKDLKDVEDLKSQLRKAGAEI
ncbi:MAG: cytochrome c biogenesis protein CcdA [Fimbriimonadaceae bacterium]